MKVGIAIWWWRTKTRVPSRNAGRPITTRDHSDSKLTADSDCGSGSQQTLFPQASARNLNLAVLSSGTCCPAVLPFPFALNHGQKHSFSVKQQEVDRAWKEPAFGKAYSENTWCRKLRDQYCLCTKEASNRKELAMTREEWPESTSYSSSLCLVYLDNLSLEI